MAIKRDARDAFSKTKPNGQLSAFAAARLTQLSKPVIATAEQSCLSKDEKLTAALVGATPYDGRSLDNGFTIESRRVPSVDDFSQISSGKLSSFDVEDILQDDAAGFRVVLKQGQVVTAIGEYNIEVIKGSATVYGAILRPQNISGITNRLVPGSGKHRVFAFSISALPQITAKRDGTYVHISRVQPSFNKLGKLSPLFRNISSTDVERSFTILRSIHDDVLQRSLTLLQIENEHNTLLVTLLSKMEICERQCTIVLGAKSAGKSTLNRIFCNGVVTMANNGRCLYLDLDPGQPEFGPPGQISLVDVTAPLLGPPFSHTATAGSKHFRLLRSHTIASSSFKDAPEYYLTCIRDLIRYICHNGLDNVPLVVNTCGWISGLGANVNVNIVSLLHFYSPDIVVLDPVDGVLVQSLQSACSTTQMHRLPRRITKPAVRTPAELRTMQTMAYFHQDQSIGNSVESRWHGKPIDCLWPYTASYDGADSVVHIVMSYDYSPDPIFLGEVLEGSVVAILSTSDQAFTTDTLPTHDSHNESRHSCRDIGPHILRTTEGLPYIACGASMLLDPAHSECVGLALVRAIDVERRTLHLISPVPLDQLMSGQDKNQRTVLVRGGFDPPEWAYLESLYHNDQSGGRGFELEVEERPWVSRKEMVGVEGAVWRLRHPPMASAIAK